MTSANRDYYEVLGVDRNADDQTVKSAYRRLARQYHPDRNPGDERAAERMKEINEAYAVLGNPQKRREYDLYGHSGLEGYTQEDLFRGVNFASIFDDLGLGRPSGFGDSFFDTFFGGRADTRRERGKGADLRYDVDVTLEEVATGVEKTIQVPHEKPCPDCHGTGAQSGITEKCQRCGGTGQLVTEQRSGTSLFRRINPCPDCRGQGEIVKEPCQGCLGQGVLWATRELTIQVPAGADTGHTIRVEGESEPGETRPGDLYVMVNVQRHPQFRRRGADIYVQESLDFTTAALGGQVQVPTLNGDQVLDIPEGTQSGAIFRIPGEGLPYLQAAGQGDEYVIVELAVPIDLTEREKELLQEFARLRQEQPGDGPGPELEG